MPDSKVTTSGPIFIDAPRKLIQAVNTALNDIAVDAQGRVRGQLKKGHGRITGTLQRNIFGYQYKDLHAVVDAGQRSLGANLIYSYWVEGVSTLNKKSVFKGYFMFRNVAKWLQKGPKEVDDYFRRALLETFR